MTEREIADWEREIRHAEKMQEQRKSKQCINVIKVTYSIRKNTYTAKDNDNEINNQ